MTNEQRFRAALQRIETLAKPGQTVNLSGALDLLSDITNQAQSAEKFKTPQN